MIIRKSSKPMLPSESSEIALFELNTESPTQYIYGELIFLMLACRHMSAIILQHRTLLLFMIIEQSLCQITFFRKIKSFEWFFFLSGWLCWFTAYTCKG